jgi:hypothetical protein
MSTRQAGNHFTVLLSRGYSGIWLRTFAAYGDDACLVCDANVTGIAPESLKATESWAEGLCAGVTMQTGGGVPSVR